MFDIKSTANLHDLYLRSPGLPSDLVNPGVCAGFTGSTHWQRWPESEVLTAAPMAAALPEGCLLARLIATRLKDLPFMEPPAQNQCTEEELAIQVWHVQLVMLWSVKL